MRPVRLEMEGFTAFRSPTVVDFEGADLFALSGATGSGKTSVLDAMVFALYGNVPRLADQRAVAPVIAQGMAEARVRLDFTVGDQGYTAVRVVRRQGEGRATTKEARLLVTVQDDGVGLPEGFDPHTGGNLGLQIVRTLVEGELGGTFDMVPVPEGGTRVILDVPVLAHK